MIALIDYNAGNIFSVQSALERLGIAFQVTNDPAVILKADKVIFPGQGRAGQAISELKKLGIWEILPQIQVPFLGICLGMQLLATTLEEDDSVGLNIIPGRVPRFSGQNGTLKVPQMGWNLVRNVSESPLLMEIPQENYFYFANSYYAEVNPEHLLASGNYGEEFAAIVQKDNFYGVQFHPEKSGKIGLRILKNFCALEPDKNPTSLFSKTSPAPNSFEILPAIDLIGGKCVRLSQGSFSAQKEYTDDPVEKAREFERVGASVIHVIDLEGAKEGKRMNDETVFKIAAAVHIPVQTGGGIRSFADAATLLDHGIQRVILSTAAVKDPDLIKKLVQEYGAARILISVDMRDGKVAVRGWLEDAALTLPDFLQKLKEVGITTIIFTDIAQDGMLQGPNFQSIAAVLQSGFKVLVAGGVSRISDVQKIQELGATGAIIGKALYEGNFDLQECVRKIRSKKKEMLVKRIIPCMDIAEGRVKKGTNFLNLKDAGDPVELGKLYSDMGADELVFLDIMATVENRKTWHDLVKKIAATINIPFTVGGGIKSVEDIRILLKAGADKVSIGSAAIKDPDLVRQAALEFGSQAIVISVDPKKTETGWEIYIKGGREATGVDAVEFAMDMEKLGAGELLVNSLDRDGMKSGYDLELLQAIAAKVHIPMIASSGAGKKEHFLEALTIGKADAALAASLFHFQELSVPEVKAYLRDEGILVRI